MRETRKAVGNPKHVLLDVVSRDSILVRQKLAVMRSYRVGIGLNFMLCIGEMA